MLTGSGVCPAIAASTGQQGGNGVPTLDDSAADCRSDTNRILPRRHSRRTSGDAPLVISTIASCTKSAPAGARISAWIRKVLLLDGVRNSAGTPIRNSRSVRLRDVCPSSGTGTVAALVGPILQLCQLRCEVSSVGLPRHAIGAWRGDSFRLSLRRDLRADPRQQRCYDRAVAVACNAPPGR